MVARSKQRGLPPYTILSGGSRGRGDKEHPSFIHSGYLYSASSSQLLLRGALDTAQILCRSFTPKSHRKLRMKDLPKVPIRGSQNGIQIRDPSDKRRRMYQ